MRTCSLPLPLRNSKLVSGKLISLSSYPNLTFYSRRLGCQTFVVSDPGTSAFRIFGLSAPAVEALAQLRPIEFSLAGSPLESIINQTKQKFGNKGVSGNHGMKQQPGKDKEKLAKIPRPPNAFILYRQQYHPLVKAENPEFHNNDICKSPLSNQIVEEI